MLVRLGGEAKAKEPQSLHYDLSIIKFVFLSGCLLTGGRTAASFWDYAKMKLHAVKLTAVEMHGYFYWLLIQYSRLENKKTIQSSCYRTKCSLKSMGM